MTDNNATSAAVASRADVVTDDPERYAKQLVSDQGAIEFFTEGSGAAALTGRQALTRVVAAS